MKQDVQHPAGPSNTAGGSEGRAKRRPKKRRNRFHVVMALFLAIVAVSIALVVVIVANLNFDRKGAGAQPDTAAVFGVKSISVEGDTRYSREAITGISGIYVGQSVFSVNKRRAAEQIKAAFPYIETVEVSSSSFDTIRIRVKETEPIGAIYAGGRWVVVGEDGRGLEALPVESERPSRYLYIRGADPLAEELGTVMLDERSLAIVNELRAAFVSAGLDGVGMIDLTDKTDILLDWKNQIIIALGNDANLTYEIQVAVASLPIILRERGATVRGELDIRMYSDPSITNPIISFKPETAGEEGG